MSLNMKKNNTEELAWESVDALMNELDQAAIFAVGSGIVKAKDMAEYMQASLNTIKGRILKGYRREFSDIYDEFIDEITKSGRYEEYIDFLRFRREIEDVRLP